MAQTLAQVILTVTTDFTVAATRKIAQQGIVANMEAMENLSERELKAAQVVCLAYFLSSGTTIAAGTNYTTNYNGLMQQALVMFNPIAPRLDTKVKNMMDAAIIANGAIYANGIAGLLQVNSDMSEIKLLRNYSCEELDKAIAFLRFKTGI